MILHEHFGLQHCTALYTQWHLGYGQNTRLRSFTFYHMQRLGCSIWRQIATQHLTPAPVLSTM